MTTVLLVRHGQSTADAEGLLAGWLPDVHLNDVGREQSDDLAKRLTAVRFSALLTSPLEACRETASAISSRRRKDLPTNTEVEIADCRFGDWTGMPVEVVAKEPAWDAVRHHPSGVHFPGGESLPELQGRAVRAIRRWNRRVGDNATYVAVTHSYVIQAILCDALGMHLDHFHRIEVEPGTISVVRYEQNGTRVLRVNDSAGELASFSPSRRRRSAKM